MLRRLDCVLAPTKAAVLAEKATKEPLGIDPEPFLLRVAKLGFVNTSPFDLKTLMGDQDNLLTNLAAYIRGYAENLFIEAAFVTLCLIKQHSNYWADTLKYGAWVPR